MFGQHQIHLVQANRQPRKKRDKALLLFYLQYQKIVNDLEVCPLIISIYEGRWFGLFCFVLFCSYEIHRTWMLQIMFLVSLESSQQGEVHVLIPCRLDLWCKSSWILNSFFTKKIKLNRSSKFQRNWNVPLVFLERSW